MYREQRFAAILQMRKHGYPVKEIAATFNVSVARVYQIIPHAERWQKRTERYKWFRKYKPKILRDPPDDPTYYGVWNVATPENIDGVWGDSSMFTKNDAVVASFKAGTQLRVGMCNGDVTIDQATGKVKSYMVQFGADGPFAWVAPKNLKFATLVEVQRAGLEGVGGLNVKELHDAKDPERF